MSSKKPGNQFNQKNTNISSAEMTAYWRSAYSKLSGDDLSHRLASEEGIKKAEEFAHQYNYPFIARKVSVRAGFFLRQTVALLESKQYDACVSFASGFSLLTYFIAKSISSSINFIDIDLPSIIAKRNERLLSISDFFDEKVSKKLQTKVLDLESAYQSNKSFQELFPNCSSPIFLIEGVIYFLSDPCVKWIFEQIAAYDNAAVIFDYWPDNMLEQNACFERVYKTLDQTILEQTKSFWSKEQKEKLASQFSSITDTSIQDIEVAFSEELAETPQFSDPADFFPVRILTAEKTVKST